MDHLENLINSRSGDEEINQKEHIKFGKVEMINEVDLHLGGGLKGKEEATLDEKDHWMLPKDS